MSPRRLTTRALPAVLAAGLALGGLAGCGDDDDTAATTPAAEESTTTEAPDITEPVDVGVVATGAWMRPSPMVDAAAAVYMVLSNTGTTDDALVGASVPTEVAAAAEIHETSMGDGGMMRMGEVAEIVVPAGGEVALEPGGYHVMVLDLVAPLVEGDEVPVTLSFASGAEVRVIAVARAA